MPPLCQSGALPMSYAPCYHAVMQARTVRPSEARRSAERKLRKFFKTDALIDAKHEYDRLPAHVQFTRAEIREIARRWWATEESNPVRPLCRRGILPMN